MSEAPAKAYSTWKYRRLRTQMKGKWNGNSFGGIPGRSTSHAIAKVLSLQERLRKQRVPHMTFLEDSQKAFDLLARDHTLNTLQETIDDKELAGRFVRDIGNLVAVTESGDARAETRVVHGVPQGDPNGPPLFIIGYDRCLRNIEDAHEEHGVHHLRMQTRGLVWEEDDQQPLR